MSVWREWPDWGPNSIISCHITLHQIVRVVFAKHKVISATLGSQNWINRGPNTNCIIEIEFNKKGSHLNLTNYTHKQLCYSKHAEISTSNNPKNFSSYLGLNSFLHLIPNSSNLIPILQFRRKSLNHISRNYNSILRKQV